MDFSTGLWVGAGPESEDASRVTVWDSWVAGKASAATNEQSSATAVIVFKSTFLSGVPDTSAGGLLYCAISSVAYSPADANCVP